MSVCARPHLMSKPSACNSGGIVAASNGMNRYPGDCACTNAVSEFAM